MHPGLVSSAQQRVWMADRLAGAANDGLNLPLAAELLGPFNPAALEHALGEIVRRHRVLRCVYDARDGELRQAVLEHARVRIRWVDLSGVGSEDARRRLADGIARAEAHRPFDLGADLMLRATVLRLGPESHHLLLVRHHIASDGWSLGILFRELDSLYERYWRGAASALPELPIQYADFAAWERAQLDGEAADRRLAYWRRQLAGAAPQRLFPDASRDRRVISGAVEARQLPGDLSQRAVELARRLRVTRFMLGCASFLVLLHHVTGQTDLTIGTDVTGRTLRSAEGLIGCFVNRLPLRADLAGNPTMRELLHRVKEVTLALHAHAGIPFERIVAAVNPERPASGDPLFQVMFGLHASPVHAPYWNLRLFGLRENRLLHCPNERSEFALCLYLTEGRDGLVAELRCDANRFARPVARRMLERYEDVLRHTTKNPDERLDALAARLAEADRRDAAADAGRFHARRRTLWAESIG